MKWTSIIIGLILIVLATIGTAATWNNPHSAGHNPNVRYAPIAGQPKSLDPARAYSSDEYQIIAQIYEPPLQYHYLRRPYQLVPLTAAQLPTTTYYDANRHKLAHNVNPQKIAYSVYDVYIKPGIYYQPHPAFAKNNHGRYLYLQLKRSFINKINSLQDFPRTGTRELTAHDYAYEIKRLASPKTNSPIFGLMSKYILGFSAYSKQLQDIIKTQGEHNFLDLRKYPLAGVKVISFAIAILLFTWMIGAADDGVMEAERDVAAMYRDGVNVKKNIGKAFNYYKRASSQGSAEAQHNLGNIYRQNDEIERDLDLAIQWYMAAANQGYSLAEYDLGSMYYIGLGVEKNFKEAAKWFKRAGLKGHAIAQYFLGNIYRKGEGVIIDEVAALDWYNRAAEKGVPEAQSNLGFMYSNGQGTDKNYLLSHMWFSISVSNDKLDVQEARQFLETEMTTAEIEQARQMARNWILAHGK